MGMYTELSLGVKFKPETPGNIIAAIEIMTQYNYNKPMAPNQHPLFKTDLWWRMLKSKGSYYFDRQPNLIWYYNSNGANWCLSFTNNIKNYCDEWEHFLNFIAPYVESEGFIGTLRYEKDDYPKLVFCKHGNITLKTVLEVV